MRKPYHCHPLLLFFLHTVKPVYNGHPWDHAKWLLYRGGLLIEVGGVLGLGRILLAGIQR